MEKSHGMSNTRLYRIWTAMKSRCHNKNSRNYQYYGARGIKVCDLWKDDFLAFYEWSMANSYKPDAPRGECTIDRIDTNGDYSPENCRWITLLEQERNKRNNHVILVDGDKKTAHEVADSKGVSYSSVIKEIKRRREGVRSMKEYSTERAKAKRETMSAVSQLLDDGYSLRQIAEKTGYTKSYVARLKKQIKEGV